MGDNDGGGWGELFAMAKGSGDGTPNEHDNTSSLDDDERPTQKKSNKRKRKQHGASSTTSIIDKERHAAFLDMLESRMTVLHKDTPWPSWIGLGGDLLVSLGGDHSCSGWNAANSTTKCDSCQKSALYHKVVIVDQHDSRHTSSTWPLPLFCNLRNIRCTAKLLILHHPDNATAATVAATSFTVQDNAYLTLKDQRQTLQSQLSARAGTGAIPPHEVSLLQSKMQDLSRILDRLFYAAKRKNYNNHQHSFHNLVPVIMACDALYYRLYYLQITNQLPTMSLGGCSSSSSSSINHEKGTSSVTRICFLPHPTDYFGLAYFTSDPSLEGPSCNHFLDYVQGTWSKHANGDHHHQSNGGGGDTMMEMLQRVGLDNMTSSSMKAVDPQIYYYGNGGEQDGHPLSVLRRLRFLETVAIFYRSGWSSCVDTQQETIKSLQTVRTKMQDDEDATEEETPAPSLLVEWRDSCRDFPCHLYAYATLSPGSLVAIQDFVERNRLSGGILEHGAGSGYLAKTLSKTTKVPIRAYDVCPTSVSDATAKATSNANNDYHGLTPPFVSIAHGDANTFRKELKQHSIKAEDVALLLCYPPPQSPMAYDFLKTFTNHGGKAFIHIGEFRGLTGSISFETYLLQHFECEERHPCLSWGTDASEVSMWTLKQAPTTAAADAKSISAPNLLLPCSCCLQKEAVRRCRLLRYLVYCSEHCCHRHLAYRTGHLSMHMIQLGDKQQLDFNDEQRFSLLNNTRK